MAIAVEIVERTPSKLQSSQDRRAAGPARKDFRALVDIDLVDGVGGQTEAQRQRDDAASRCAGDHVEVTPRGNAASYLLFNPRQERGGQDALDAAAVDRKDAERLTGRPGQLFPRPKERPC